MGWLLDQGTVTGKIGRRRTTFPSKSPIRDMGRCSPSKEFASALVESRVTCPCSLSISRSNWSGSFSPRMRSHTASEFVGIESPSPNLGRHDPTNPFTLTSSAVARSWALLFATLVSSAFPSLA